MITVNWKKGFHLGVVKETGENIKQIAGYKGFYVGDLGNVYSAWVRHVRPICLDYNALWEKKQFIIDHKRKSPYNYVSLQYNHKYSQQSVHRLVAIHHVENPKPGVYNVVHHCAYPSNAAKDLMWTTQAHNTDIGQKSKHHQLITPEGNTIIIRNLMKFCRENDLYSSSLYNNRYCKGYKYLGNVECP